jgi:hypothetical protein
MNSRKPSGKASARTIAMPWRHSTIGSDKPWGNCCDLFEFNVSAEFDVLDVHLQNVLATLLVGSVDEHVTIKSPGSKQRGV